MRYIPILRYLAASATILLCLSLSACVTTKRPEFPPQSKALFKPLETREAIRLSESEARQIAAKTAAKYHHMSSLNELSFAVKQSLGYAASRSSGTTALSVPGLTLTYGKLTESLAHLQKILPKLDKNPGLLAQDFVWYRIGPDYGFTGYYEPTLHASRTKSAVYHYPIYRRPPDLKKGKPYHTRHAIDRQGALAGRGLEIAWVTSEADAFFLHIQGSGRLLFEDGSVRHVLYADKNNRAYVPLGRTMRDQGLLEQGNISMKTIRECLLGNPEQCAALYDSNPSYIFFREDTKGPFGAMGRVLTPYVSTATDRSWLPHGSIAFAITSLPDKNGKATQPFYGITLPQDTGGAIKRNRVDLFCGAGEEAPHIAGHLNAKGAIYVLVKK